MAKVMYSNPSTAIDTVLNFIQSVHYNMTYGMAATLFTQNNIIAGLSQINPNYTELRANALKNKDKIGEAISIMKDYRLLDSEDVIYFGGGSGLNLNESRFSEITGNLTKAIGKTIG